MSNKSRTIGVVTALVRAIEALGANFETKEFPHMSRFTQVVSLGFLLATVPSICGMEDDNRLVHEGVIEAPLDQVWAAYTTKTGLESWMVAHAEIDLKIGGKMKTRYSPNGTVDDAKAIENTILCLDPPHMVSFRVTKAPQGFPFPNAISNMWTVVYFDAQGDRATRVREVSQGFGNDEESKKMRAFFDRGNGLTMEGLKKRFAAKPDLRKD